MERFAAALHAVGVVALVCGIAPEPAAGAGHPPVAGPRHLRSADAALAPADGAGSGERPDPRTRRAGPRTVTNPVPRYTTTRRIAPGVWFRMFRTTGIGGPVHGGLVEVNLRSPRVSVGLLRPPVIAARRTVSAMANARHALVGVNGDFFDISRTHAGVRPTGSSCGPEMDRRRALKAAVPDGQRFGPSLPLTTSAEDVIGVGTDRRGRVGRLRLAGTIRSGPITLPLRGLNQYALPVGGAGAFTSAWGTVSRRRAVCGTDAVRGGPCSVDTAEVVVRHGVVTEVGHRVRGGAIPRGTTVLVGREQAAGVLRTLLPGDRVRVHHRLTGPRRFRFALGGFPILRDGAPLAGLDPTGPAPRTAAGVSRNGRRMYLVVVDGRSRRSRGLTLAELAGLLGRVGADDAVNLDGGDSSTLAVRAPRKRAATVRNKPSGGFERPVANGIGVFSRR